VSEAAQVYLGGEIHTVDPDRPPAEAVAVRSGRIVAVGSERECRAAAGDPARVVDLRGRALLPGFIDTHLHPIMMVYYAMNADLSGLRSIEAVRERLREAGARAGGEEWAIGLAFDDEALDEPRIPTRRDLDVACPDRPALIVKHDGHLVIGNSRAIEHAGVSGTTPDPEGGEIDRGADGEPSGPFRETATALLLSAMPGPDLERMRDQAEAVFRRLAAHGVTSAGIVLQTDAEGPAGAAGALEVAGMQMLLPAMPQSTYALLIASDLEKVLAARATPLHDAAAGRRVGGLKIFSDGTFGSCTACMSAPFHDQPERRGFMTLGEGEIYRRMSEAHEAGLQIAIHAIGDEANRRCVALYERLLAEQPRADHRHRLEHASLLDADTIERIARLGLVVSTQPMFIHSEKDWLHRRLGPERARLAYPLRSLRRAGVKVAGASDAPVESSDVLHAISCCVTREGFEVHEAIGVEDAVRMFTLDAAYAQFEEGEKGSISPGKRADLVVLSESPWAVAPDEIRRIGVEQTLIAGRVVYAREPETRAIR
jgi:predicted amidohydrolase YtcJ